MKDKKMDEVISAVKLLKVKRGDALILQCTQRIHQEAYEHLKGVMKTMLDRLGKGDIPIIILEDGMDISILRLTRKDGE